MIAPLAKFIDWSAIQVLSLLESPPNAQGPRLEEALQFLKGPDFIPAESQPARVEFISGESATIPLSHAATVRVRGEQCRLWPALPLRGALAGTAGDRSAARSVVTVSDHRFRFPLIARRCNRAGFNAATLVAPYHFQRRPRRSLAT